MGVAAPDQQEFTKDLDLAVPAECIAAVEGELKKRKLAHRNLRIGGLGVWDGDLRLDFIDRRLYHAALFREAVEAARRTGRFVTIGRVKFPLVPVEYLVAMKMVPGSQRMTGT